MESINSFSKGMNKDINPLNSPKGNYIDAQNVRLVNDAETTSLSLNNILGNDFKMTIPDSPLIQKVTIISGANTLITIDGQTGAAFNTAGWTGQDLYDYIINEGSYTNCAQSIIPGTPTYNLYYNSNYILIIPITFSYFVPIATNPLILDLDTSYVPAQTGLEIIGSTTIRDDIYLFTTNNTTLNPGGHSNDSNLPADPSSVGVIWKMTYNKVSLVVPTLTLIYANYVDFSTYYAIPPSACLGRYENTEIQRLYWTDNFNKLRSLNVADDQVLAFDPTILNITPAVDFDIPKLQSLGASTGNDLTVGVIQCAYRLKNNGGAITTFSELSNIVTLVTTTESTQNYGNPTLFATYTGSAIGTTVTKVITWQIDNIDRDYDRIETVLVFRDSLTGTPVITMLDDAPITGDSYTVIYDGTQNVTPVTLTEFLALSGAFTHCKTIETKDNRLFAANIRSQFSELDYDARAYRFPLSDTDLSLIENGATNVYDTTLPQPWVTGAAVIAPSTWETIGDTSDAINPDQDINKYKRNSTVLGGTGPNIEYEFYTVAIAADIERVTTGINTDFNVPYISDAAWRFTYTRTGQDLINLNVESPTNQSTSAVQEYPTFPINDGFKYPQFNGLFHGYQRNEIYRFAITFKDKSGNPFFTKWIGDIKMPDYSDPNDNAYYEDGSTVALAAFSNSLDPTRADFRPSFTAVKNSAIIPNKEAFVQSLGIKFKVYIPDAIINLISGYEITRVERTTSDMTIVSEGSHDLIDIYAGGTDNFYYMTNLNNGSGGLGVFGSTSFDRLFYTTPNINNPLLPEPSNTMTLKIKGQMNAANTDASILMQGGGDPYYMYKLYLWDSDIGTNTTPLGLDYVSPLVYLGQTVDDVTGKTVFNYDYDIAGPNDTLSDGLGNQTYYLRLDGSIDTTLLAGGNRFLCSLERTLLAQYGGNTYTSRANNTYMSCSMFRPVRTSQLGVADEPIIFGGDTYVNMYDSCRWAKNWGGGAAGNRGVGPTKASLTRFFPVSSPINTDLRHGVYMNKDMDVAYDSPGSIMVETYNYNPIYSAQTNVKQYFPKPDPFILNEEYDTRFHASEIKINGELTDSWGVFLPNNYWDTEGSYGPINAITAMGPDMYFWQNRAFGTMSINPRVMVTDTGTDAQIQLGVGSVLQRHDYISIEGGLQHQWGMTKSSQKLYWMDVNKKKFFDYSKGQLTPESDVKGMLSWFNTYLKNNINIIDKPVYEDAVIGINGIRSVYDYKYNQAIFTFSDGYFAGFPTGTVQTKYTLHYDDFIGGFSSFASYTPKVYITDFTRIFSTNPTSLSDIYMHDTGDYGVFYQTSYPTTVKLVVNDNYQSTKVFDNIMYDSQSLQYSSTYDNYQNDFLDTWESIRIYNDYQNTDVQSIALNNGLKRKERTWQLQVPRNRVLYNFSPSPNIFDPSELSTPNNKTFGERMRDKYIVVDLTYNNNNNRLLTCNNFRTTYRLSPR